MSPFKIQQAIRAKLGAKYPFNDVHIEYHFVEALRYTSLHVWLFFGTGDDRSAVNALIRIMTDVVTKSEVDYMISLLKIEVFQHIDPIKTPTDHV